MEPSTARTLRLHDGRFLGYAEFGDPEGRPAFFFHGLPGSRPEGRLAHHAAKAAGVRIVSLDRPGTGLSDFKRGRTLLDWPRDIVEAADALRLEEFAVMGYSGGGPYVAACAFQIPNRLRAAGIIAGTGPLDAPEATKGMSRQNRLGFFIGRRLPWLARVPYWYFGWRDPEVIIRQMARSIAPVDGQIAERPQVREILLEDLREAFRRGSRGATYDFLLLCRPWGFRLEDIAMPVYFWQGDADVNVPVSMGHYQAQAIPDCRATFYPGEGHLLVVDRMPEILAAIFA
ncbi:MAG: alpha/beta hydrolase [Chloroflexi bacterium]|nr:alpha/beta hydrolase [Chloroflexota bacterium]